MAQNDVLAEHSLAVRTAEERRAMAVKAGQASGVARRRQHEVTDIYGRWLATKHDIKLMGEDGKYETQEISGYALINRVMGEIIAKGNKESVMMISEVRKAREGQTYHIDGGAVDQDLQETSAEVLKAEFEAELAKRDAIMAKRAEALPPDAAPEQVVGYEVESAEGVPAVQPMAQEATIEPTRQETMKGDDATQP